jgi:uncharacterized membrane protein
MSLRQNNGKEKIDEDEYAWLLFWLALALLTTLFWVGIYDGMGRKPWHHTGPLPESVGQIDPQTYILNGKTDPNDICIGGSTGLGDPTIDKLAHIRGIDGVYLRCSREQTWNDHRAKSVNFAHSIGPVVTNPIYISIIGGSLLIFGLPALLVLERNLLRVMRAKRRKKEEAKTEYDVAERMLRELTAAFARCDISREEYEAGIARADAAGVPGAE